MSRVRVVPITARLGTVAGLVLHTLVPVIFVLLFPMHFYCSRCVHVRQLGGPGLQSSPGILRHCLFLLPSVTRRVLDTAGGVMWGFSLLRLVNWDWVLYMEVVNITDKAVFRMIFFFNVDLHSSDQMTAVMWGLAVRLPQCSVTATLISDDRQCTWAVI